MICSTFLFLLCLFISSGTSISTKTKGFYISGYNTSNSININETTIKYQYERNELLNLTCHIKQKSPIVRLRWWHNEKNISGIKDSSSESKLQFNITKSNDKDRLTCFAFEDNTGLKDDEKKNEKTVILLLEYENKTSDESTVLVNMMKNEDSENWFVKMTKRKLFWIVIVVIIVVIILASILVVANKRSYYIKDDKVFLHPAISNTSVFSEESREHIILQGKITKVNLSTNYTYCNTPIHGSCEIINSEYQEPMDSQAYCEPQTYCEPEKQLYAEPISKAMRKAKDIVYVNYNKNKDSANINNEDTGLYQNFADVCNDVYYTETC